MDFKPFYTFIFIIFVSCSQRNANLEINSSIINNAQLYKQYYKTIQEIPLPDGFERLNPTDEGFSNFLRNLPLKQNNTVYLYDGREKGNQSAQFAVLDISVGDKDLQQCADAVMRIRAEFLFSEANYSAILFTDNEGTAYRFNPPYNRTNFQQYLNRVFGMCGSASLEKQLKPTNLQNIVPGDVIIKGGFPGHAVIVLDVAKNAQNEKIYMIAQSYMPAQDIHILVNPNNDKLSPWYKVDQDLLIETPEYTFKSTQVKRW